ncbi:hypothetical protein Sjap_021251 [Stephania japonica]|uniref:RRM domain-containing protein n=1 Tax=Stephania japonica TaxID=461633 RepID=A0AAP0EVH9_9MAGN
MNSAFRNGAIRVEYSSTSHPRGSNNAFSKGVILDPRGIHITLASHEYRLLEMRYLEDRERLRGEERRGEETSNLDKTLERIQLLCSSGEIEQLRRESLNVSQNFHLLRKILQVWGESGLTFGFLICYKETARSESAKRIKHLFFRATVGIKSYTTWIGYLAYFHELDLVLRARLQDVCNKLLSVFEKGPLAGGKHGAPSSRVISVYTEFNKNIYLTVERERLMADDDETMNLNGLAPIAEEVDHDNEDGNPSSTSSDDDSDDDDDHQDLELELEQEQEQAQQALEKHLNHNICLNHRVLICWLHDYLSVSLCRKMSWELEHVNVPERSSEFEAPSHVTSAYNKAMEMYNTRANYEEQISREGASETEKLHHFMAYLHFETSSGDPARVQILYERAITEFPISSDLWLSYAQYLDQTIKVPKIVVDAYSRATRNCTWVKELWVGYLLSMERACASEKELSAVFEEALQCSFSNSDEYLDLFLTRIDGLRRRISTGMSEEDGLNYAAIREIFQRATDYLSPSLMNSEGLLHLHSYWSRLELHHAKDLAAARGVWESLLKTSGTMIEAWQKYVNMEIEMGHLDEARAIYRRCYCRRFAGTGSEDICHGWLRFEREYGTLDDYDRTKRKVHFLSLALLVMFLQITFKLKYVLDLLQFPISILQILDANLKTENETLTLKRKVVGELHVVLQIRRVAKKKKKKKMMMMMMMMKKFEFDFREEVSVAHYNMMCIQEEKNLKLFSRCEEVVDEKDQRFTRRCTFLRSKLGSKAKDEDLRDFFSDVGGVTGIRLLKDKFTGKSRGLAYVDFVDDKHLSAAVTKNKHILLVGRLCNLNSINGKKKRNFFSSRDEHESEWRSYVQEKAFFFLVAVKGLVHLDNKLTIGKTAFLPRTVVRNIGRSSNAQEDDASSKSNDEFRKMLLKK